jgi:rhodanese-related sulfurtransferase
MNSGDPADPAILEAYGVLSAPVPDDAKNYADELTDFGIAPNPAGPVNIASDTPLVLPGAARTSTDQLKAALKLAPSLLLIDARPCKYKFPSIAGAYCPQNSDEKPFVDQVGTLTSRHYATPLVVFCAGAKCWESYMTATYLVHAGYTRIIWYRGGVEAWEQAGNTLKPARPMHSSGGP